MRSCSELWGNFWDEAQDKGISIDGIHYMGVSKNRGTPKSSILIGFSTINHPFWGTTIFGNSHIPLLLSYNVILWLGGPFHALRWHVSAWAFYCSSEACGVEGVPSHWNPWKWLRFFGTPLRLSWVIMNRPVVPYLSGLKKEQHVGPFVKRRFDQWKWNVATGHLEMIILGAGPHANESSTLVVWFPFHWTSWLCFLAGRL